MITIKNPWRFAFIITGAVIAFTLGGGEVGSAFVIGSLFGSFSLETK